jgi:formylglycine-generating enzyme required for sulfatase activity
VPLSALAFSLLLASPGPILAAKAPDYYVRSSTWQETMVESLSKLAGSELKDGFEPFESETIRGGEPARRVSIQLDGARELYLFVTGCPDVKWGIGDWGEAALIDKAGKAEALTESRNFRVLKGRCETNITLRAGLYQKMSIGQRSIGHGLNVQADSVILVSLDGNYARFEAWIGVDNWAGTNGSLRFSAVGARTAARKRLFELAAADFPTGSNLHQMGWEKQDRIYEFDWRAGDWGGLAARYADACNRVPPLQARARGLARMAAGKEDLHRMRDVYYASRELDESLGRAKAFDFDGLKQALADLQNTFPDRFPSAFAAEVEPLEKGLRACLDGFNRNELADFARVAGLNARVEELKSEALLANPLLDFEKLMLIRRVPRGEARRTHWEGFGYGEYLGVPRQSSWNYGTMPNVNKWTNEVVTLSPVRGGALSSFFKPPGTPLVADIDLHWDADKLLFSMPDTNRNWQVCELRSDGSGFRQLTPSFPDVHNYDPLYLPSGDIVFLSTAPLQGVPCNASVIVGMMYKMGPNGEGIHQLTFEQDHDYTPSILNNGRVLYLRWDYTDTPHVWNRLLMSMNPDGTGQMEYYGANSYWPNAIFYARPIPNHETKIVGIVTGHHEGRVGELFILDPAKGRHETDGVVQRIPRRGPPVEAKIEDKLTEHSWPKFLHPWPLSDKYFLVACKPEPESLWGIYLVDVFDNMVLLKEEEGCALLEPVPFAKQPKRPVIQERTQPANKEALVYLEDIYVGPGLKGVPRGTIKRLRLFTYHFGFQTLAGIDHRVGADGPWEAKRVLGTVPVERDGSALFMVPAKLPISFQPLDDEGKAVALMRSWMTAMPGESVSCVGCHDRQSSAPGARTHRLALSRPPSRITPIPGPPRGFSFVHDVQPVLDKYCVGCHDGKSQADGQVLPDLRRDQGAYWVCRNGELDGKLVRGVSKQELLGKYGAVFEPSYVALRQFIRVGGLESDLHVLAPMEFHANTSELVQMLTKGHHNVKLDADAWNRLITWIDLNAPCHGRWGDVTRLPGNQCQRRVELRKLFGGVVEDWEIMPELDADYELPEPVIPEPTPPAVQWRGTSTNWAKVAEQRRRIDVPEARSWHSVELDDGSKMEFVRLPAGEFVMGDWAGAADEQPARPARIEKPFWIAKCEVSNEQFAKFDASHDSRFEHRSSWIFSEEYLGWPLNKPGQPVVRVSWDQAMSFCRWLTDKLCVPVTLPTEAQWEYACRAGTVTPLNYGTLDADFSRHANMGDASLRRLASEGWRPKAPDLVPRDSRVDDGALVTAECGRYLPNAWGLCDMHGNAAEWTRSAYLSYGDDESSDESAAPLKVVRGGSWRDRPRNCRSSARWAYPPYQKVFNVGFRVVIEESDKPLFAVPEAGAAQPVGIR